MGCAACAGDNATGQMLRTSPQSRVRAQHANAPGWTRDVSEGSRAAEPVHANNDRLQAQVSVSGAPVVAHRSRVAATLLLKPAPQQSDPAGTQRKLALYYIVHAGITDAYASSGLASTSIEMLRLLHIAPLRLLPALFMKLRQRFVLRWPVCQYCSHTRGHPCAAERDAHTCVCKTHAACDVL